MKIGRQFAEERMYSKNEEERLYSTGNDELDELLERAFCEGYEYAQREFGIMDNARPISSPSRINSNAAKVMNRSGRSAADVLKNNTFKGTPKAGQVLGVGSISGANKASARQNMSQLGQKLSKAVKGNPKAAGLAAAGLGLAATAGLVRHAKREGWKDAKMGVQRTAKY